MYVCVPWEAVCFVDRGWYHVPVPGGAKMRPLRVSKAASMRWKIALRSYPAGSVRAWRISSVVVVVSVEDVEVTESVREILSRSPVWVTPDVPAAVSTGRCGVA